jgi:DNA-binding XRE family transcriptional regulator
MHVSDQSSATSSKGSRGLATVKAASPVGGESRENNQRALNFIAVGAEAEQNSTIVYLSGAAMVPRDVGIASVAELGKVVRAVRKESGLTQRDAAALCNVSLPFLNGLERGKSTAQVGKVLAVCSRFGIEVRLRLPGETE